MRLSGSRLMVDEIMLDIKVYLFGLPRIEQDQRKIHIPRRKSIAILAYLAVTGKPQSREALAALCYPEYNQADARNYLRRDLFELKNSLGKQFLLIEREQVALYFKADLWVDVVEFRDHIEKARLHQALHSRRQEPLCEDCYSRLTTAAGLYSADFMAGFNLPGSREFEEWQFFQAENLRQQFAEALRGLISWHSHRYEFERAIAYGQRWLTLDPYHEPAHRELMRLYAWSGQQAAALRQYQECARRLHDELKIEPGEETNALYDAIRNRRIGMRVAGESKPEEPAPGTSAAGGVQHNLPFQDAPLTGRAGEIERIVNCVRDQPECRLLTLVGPGGIGKTSLAIEAASRLAGDPGCPFCDGIYFVSLVAVTRANALITAIAAAIKLPLSPDPGQRAQQLFDYLQSRRLLLLLDNFEHLVDEGSIRLLIEVLEHAPQVKLIVTSRIRLNARSEHVLPLRGLETPPTGADFQDQPVERIIADYSAVELFSRRARRQKPDFVITAANIQAIVQICQMVEGMPLGIELAAAWVEVLTPAEIAAEIGECLDFLTTGWPDVPGRHRSMRAVFDSSWGLLNETERIALMRLTVFSSSFSRPAAQAVSGASIHTLLALQNKSWLQYDKDNRFQIHELLCQYANEKLQADPAAWQLARDHYTRYYAAFLDEQAAKIKGAGQREAFDAIAVEFENIHQAWQWLVENGQVDSAVQHMLLALYRYAEARARPFELNHMIELALESPVGATGSPGDLHLHAILLTAGAGFNRYGIPERYFPYDIHRSHDQDIRQGWAQAGAIGTLQAMGFWGILLPFLYSRIGEPLEPMARLRELLSLFREQNHRWELANALFLLGGMLLNCRIGQGEPASDQEEDRQMLSESLGIFQALGDQSSSGYVLYYLGLLSVRQRKYSEAIEQLLAAQANVYEVGEWPFTAEIHRELANVYVKLGDFESAFQNMHAMSQVFTDMGYKLRAAIALSEESITALRYSDLEHARQTRQQSMRLYQEVGHPFGAAWGAWEMVEIERVAGNLAGAQQWLEDAIILFKDLGDHTSPIFIQRGLGDIAHAKGDYAGAREHFLESLRLARGIHRWAYAYALCGSGRAEVALGEAGAARRHFSQALQTAAQIDEKGLMLIALAGYAALSASIGDPEQAVELGSLVMHHKHSWNETKAQMAALLESITSVQPGHFAAARDRGLELDLDQAVRRFSLIEE